MVASVDGEVKGYLPIGVNVAAYQPPPTAKPQKSSKAPAPGDTKASSTADAVASADTAQSAQQAAQSPVKAPGSVMQQVRNMIRLRDVLASHQISRVIRLKLLSLKQANASVVTAANRAIEEGILQELTQRRVVRGNRLHAMNSLTKH